MSNKEFFDERYYDYAFQQMLEEEYPLSFPNNPEEIPDDEDDFYDGDEFFRSVTSEKDLILMEKLMIESDERIDHENHELFKFEIAPLRHKRKKWWKEKEWTKG